MYIDLTDEEKKRYERRYVSRVDWGQAHFCLGMLLKKGWHSQEMERRGTAYYQQAAYTTAFAVAYARPFNHGNDWDKLRPEDYVANEAQAACHRRIIDLRNQIFAHSDRRHFSVRPWRSGEFQTDIVRLPALRVTRDDAQLLEEMLTRYLERAENELRAIVPAVLVSGWTPADLPFDELEVGESFFVPIGEAKSAV